MSDLPALIEAARAQIDSTATVSLSQLSPAWSDPANSRREPVERLVLDLILTSVAPVRRLILYDLPSDVGANEAGYARWRAEHRAWKTQLQQGLALLSVVQRARLEVREFILERGAVVEHEFPTHLLDKIASAEPAWAAAFDAVWDGPAVMRLEPRSAGAWLMGRDLWTSI